MPDQPKSLPIRGDRRGNGRTPAQTNEGSVSHNQGSEEARLDAPRSTPRVDPQRVQSRRAVDDRRQNSAIAANPIFPREGIPRSYQIAPGQEQQNSRVSASGALMFNSTLDLTLRAFANIPRGDYGNVAAYLRANPSIIRANPQDLRREAIHAYQYASRGSEIQYSGKMMYGDSCIQQYLILKRLQQLIQKLVERRQTRRGPTEGLDDLIKSYFDQLLDKTSSSRKQLYEEFNEACANAKRSVQSTNPNPHPNAPRAQPAQPGAHARPPPSQGQRHSVSGRPPPESPLVDPNESATGLDSRYIVRPSSYYQAGRVFAILWHEPFNDSQGNTYLSDNVSTGLYGERIYSSIRRMVVVRQDHGCSVCIQINTYGKRGLGKFKTSQRDIDAHSIIHMDDTTPRQLPGEPMSDKRPIAVRKASPDQQLNPWSRLCYSQPHTVQHTVKALDVGWVVKESLPYLLSYFQKVNALP